MKYTIKYNNWLLNNRILYYKSFNLYNDRDITFYWSHSLFDAKKINLIEARRILNLMIIKFYCLDNDETDKLKIINIE